MRTAFNVFDVSEHFLCSGSCAGCSAVRGECVMHGVQIGRLTGSERNLVALCAFGQVIPTTSRLRRGRVRGRATHGAKSTKSFHTSKVFLAQYFFILYELKQSVLVVNEFCIICQKCGDCPAMPSRNVRVRLFSRANRFKYIQTQKISFAFMHRVPLLLVNHHHNPLLIEAARSGIMNVSCKTEEEPARVAGSSSSSTS